MTVRAMADSFVSGVGPRSSGWCQHVRRALASIYVSKLTIARPCAQGARAVAVCDATWLSEFTRIGPDVTMSSIYTAAQRQVRSPRREADSVSRYETRSSARVAARWRHIRVDDTRNEEWLGWATDGLGLRWCRLYGIDPSGSCPPPRLRVGGLWTQRPTQ